MTQAAHEVFATDVAFDADFVPELNRLLNASIIQPMSNNIEIVAKTSSQKKNENMYPYFTYEAMIISRENSTIARQVKKYQKSSIDFGKIMTRRSSMKRV